MAFVSITVDGEEVNAGEDFERLTVAGPGDRFSCTKCGESWDSDELDEEEANASDCPDGDQHTVTSSPLSWLNHAGVSFDEDEDSVTVSISVGDPRGAFTFTVRRLPDGRLIMHTPYPGEGMPHVATRELHPGTLAIGY